MATSERIDAPPERRAFGYEGVDDRENSHRVQHIRQTPEGGKFEADEDQRNGDDRSADHKEDLRFILDPIGAIARPFVEALSNDHGRRHDTGDERQHIDPLGLEVAFTTHASLRSIPKKVAR